jgi:hypothetical protein
MAVRSLSGTRKNKDIMPEQTTRITRMLAILGMAGPFLFALLILLQDIIQYDWLVAHGQSPFTQSPISTNELGPYGFLQTINFSLFGLCVIALAIGLHRTVQAGSWSRLHIAPMFLIGISMVLSSFTTDLSKSHPTWHGTINSAAFYTFVLAHLVTYFSMWRRFRKDLRWRGYGRYSLLNGILTLPAAEAARALGTAFHFSGFYIWLALFPLAWLELVAIRLWAVSHRSSE